MSLLMQMVQEFGTTNDIKPENYPTLKPQSFHRIYNQAMEVVGILEDERDMFTQMLQTKDRTIQTLRNCLEETFEKEGRDLHYGIVFGILASTFIYFIVLSYVLH